MEALGNEGKVEEAMELSKTIEEYKRKKRDLEVLILLSTFISPNSVYQTLIFRILSRNDNNDNIFFYTLDFTLDFYFHNFYFLYFRMTCEPY